MGFAKTEDEWAARASAFLKAELKKGGRNLCGIGQTTEKHGLKEKPKPAITNKLKRGTFSATFFLACLAAMGNSEGVALADI